MLIQNTRELHFNCKCLKYKLLVNCTYIHFIFWTYLLKWDASMDSNASNSTLILQQKTSLLSWELMLYYSCKQIAKCELRLIYIAAERKIQSGQTPPTTAAGIPENFPEDAICYLAQYVMCTLFN